MRVPVLFSLRKLITNFQVKNGVPFVLSELDRRNNLGVTFAAIATTEQKSFNNCRFAYISYLRKCLSEYLEVR